VDAIDRHEGPPEGWGSSPNLMRLPKTLPVDGQDVDAPEVMSHGWEQQDGGYNLDAGSVWRAPDASKHTVDVGRIEDPSELKITVVIDELPAEAPEMKVETPSPADAVAAPPPRQRSRPSRQMPNVGALVSSAVGKAKHTAKALGETLGESMQGLRSPVEDETTLDPSPTVHSSPPFAYGPDLGADQEDSVMSPAPVMPPSSSPLSYGANETGPQVSRGMSGRLADNTSDHSIHGRRLEGAGAPPGPLTQIVAGLDRRLHPGVEAPVPAWFERDVKARIDRGVGAIVPEDFFGRTDLIGRTLRGMALRGAREAFERRKREVEDSALAAIPLADRRPNALALKQSERLSKAADVAVMTGLADIFDVPLEHGADYPYVEQCTRAAMAALGVPEVVRKGDKLYADGDEVAEAIERETYADDGAVKFRRDVPRNVVRPGAGEDLGIGVTYEVLLGVMDGNGRHYLGRVAASHLPAPGHDGMWSEVSAVRLKPAGAKRVRRHIEEVWPADQYQPIDLLGANDWLSSPETIGVVTDEAVPIPTSRATIPMGSEADRTFVAGNAGMEVIEANAVEAQADGA